MKIPLSFIFILGVVGMSLFNCNAAPESAIRRPAVANRFYTGDPAQLKHDIERYLAKGTKLSSTPPIILSPHAGYIFSGPVAGIGFATIDKSVNTVILIGPSHHKYFSGISIPAVDAYETPLGKVPLEKKGVAQLRKSPVVHAHSDAHSMEHCLEVQIPFLQVLLNDFTIIPIITGDIKDHAAIAELIYPLIGTKTLVVVSTDLSHYHSHEEAKEIDTRSIEAILNSNTQAPLDACGENPIRVAMYLAKKMHLKPKLLDARTSFETAPPQYADKERVVGYMSIVYLPEESAANQDSHGTSSLSENDKLFMLNLARDALNKAVKGEAPPEPKEIPPAALEVCGCFVTLHRADNGNLRGCIGNIEGVKPLYQGIIDNAKNAAFNDPRFPKVTEEELASIRMEVSVLTKPMPFTYKSREELLQNITPGRDGIILSKGMHMSTFLPQVWEQLPDKVEFLEHLAIKARLDRGDWQSAEYKKYQAIHFAEK